MKSKKRTLFGVIAAGVSDISQRELLLGVIEEAKKNNIDIAVISNIINENFGDADVPYENIIYELINLPALDGFIMLSEPFSNEKLRDKINNLLSQKNVPVVIAGAVPPDLDLPNARFINTSNENDMEETVDHLIEDHGLTDIDMLTGYSSIEASHLRVNGYKKSLEKHGIQFDENKVIYGDFWTESGRCLAREYIEGKRPYPQALVCANDYMAFGLEDEFAERKINVSDLFSVIGFDISLHRINHSPLLTSYQFNRKQLGRDAVKILYKKLKSNIDIEFRPPKGKLIHGLSCHCDLSLVNLSKDQLYSKIDDQYMHWSLNSNIDQKFTSCRTLDELMQILGEYQYLVRYVQDIYVCLYENWYEYNYDDLSDNLSCRSIMPWLDTSVFDLKRNFLTDITFRSENPAAYYFNPLVFDKHLFGYMILKYDNPDSYDTNFKFLIKTFSNSLEILRLKHDINYLLECQPISKMKDNLTALNNDIGMKKAFDDYVHIHDKTKKLFFVMIRCCLFHNDFDDIGKKHRFSSILDIAEALKQFSTVIHGTCGRINDNTFLCILNTVNASAGQIEDYFLSFITQCKTYLSFYGIDSFVYCIAPYCEDNSYTAMKQKCIENLNLQSDAAFELRCMNHYQPLIEMRNEFYLNPQKEFTTNELCQKYSFSPSYLRVIYKKIFGVSFIHDCIVSRIYKAKYLLLTTDLKLSEISDVCGYNDIKYFLRQFHTVTGVTPSNYRMMN